MATQTHPVLDHISTDEYSKSVNQTIWNNTGAIALLTEIPNSILANANDDLPHHIAAYDYALNLYSDHKQRNDDEYIWSKKKQLQNAVKLSDIPKPAKQFINSQIIAVFKMAGKYGVSPKNEGLEFDFAIEQLMQAITYECALLDAPKQTELKLALADEAKNNGVSIKSRNTQIDIELNDSIESSEIRVTIPKIKGSGAKAFHRLTEVSKLIDDARRIIGIANKGELESLEGEFRAMKSSKGKDNWYLKELAESYADDDSVIMLGEAWTKDGLDRSSTLQVDFAKDGKPNQRTKESPDDIQITLELSDELNGSRFSLVQMAELQTNIDSMRQIFLKYCETKKLELGTSAEHNPSAEIA
ncbi:hypothetical protein AB4254_11705 [Vibrio breoganii]